MKTEKLNYLYCLLFFIILAAITFRCTWPADHVFNASDLNIGRLGFIKNHLPQSFVGYFTANQLLGSTGAGFSLFNVQLSLLPLTVFANAFYGLFLVGASMAMVWFLRIWHRSWLAAVFGALVGFWVSSITLASSGHAFKMEVLAFSVLSLCLIEKAVRSTLNKRALAYAILAGLCVGIMMLEQQDVALLAGLFIGPYVLFRLIQLHSKSWIRWTAVLVPVGIISLLLAGNTLFRSYNSNVAKATPVQGGDDEKWNFITQWSMVPTEWPDLIAQGWAGWSTSNPDGPYWGRIGQSEDWKTTGQGFRNFRLDGIYFGIIPFLMGLFGLITALREKEDKDRWQIIFWSVAGILGFLLAFGKYSLLYKLFYQLPLVNNIRAPIKLLNNFQIALAIVSAYGLDRLLADGKKGQAAKVLWMAGAGCAGFMLLAALKVSLFPASHIAQISEMGLAQFSEQLVQNMSRAWMHGGILALIAAGGAFLVWKGVMKRALVAGIFILAIAADSLMFTSHYFTATDISALKKGNMVTNFLKENQGNERTYFADQGGIYNQWLASDGPFHGLNLFNIWQMSRMPGDYKEFLGTVGRNQFRLWELAAIKYVALPETALQQIAKNPQLAQQFQPALNYQVPTAQGMRKDVLLEYKGSIPRFSLFSGWKTVPVETQCQTLASPDHHVRTTVLLAPESNLGTVTGTMNFRPLEAKVTKRSASMKVQSDKPAIVRFSQYFQAGWRVFVDGKPVKLLRVDYLCMGAAVPAGEHLVEFRCDSGAGKAYFALALLIASLAAAVWLLRSVRKVDA